MLTDAAQKVARQQLQRSPPQCLLLPLATEHEQLLLLLLTEGLAVAHLRTERVGTKTGVLEVELVLLMADLPTTSRNSRCFSTSSYSVGRGMRGPTTLKIPQQRRSYGITDNQGMKWDTQKGREVFFFYI